MSMSRDAVDLIEAAFGGGFGGAHMTCSCGRTFYCHDDSFEWEDGELESLESDDSAVCLQWSPSMFVFEGREVARDCDCWHERARRVAAWLRDNAYEVARFLALDKRRAVENAAQMFTVEEVVVKVQAEEPEGSKRRQIRLPGRKRPVTNGERRHGEDEGQGAGAAGAAGGAGAGAGAEGGGVHPAAAGGGGGAAGDGG